MLIFKHIVLLVGLSVSVWADFSMDSMRSKLLSGVVSLYFETKGYGKVENATVDTVKKTLHFTLMPEGEAQKLTIDIGKYSVKKIEGEDNLVLQNIKTNRTWLTRFFANEMEKGIEIPMGTASKRAGSLLLGF